MEYLLGQFISTIVVHACSDQARKVAAPAESQSPMVRPNVQEGRRTYYLFYLEPAYRNKARHSWSPRFSWKQYKQQTDRYTFGTRLAARVCIPGPSRAQGPGLPRTPGRILLVAPSRMVRCFFRASVGAKGRT